MQITGIKIHTVDQPKDKDPWRLSPRSLLKCYCNVIRPTSSQLAVSKVMKLNGSGFTSHLCTYRLNWARRTPWELWYEWGDTAHQTQDSKLSPVGLRPSTLTPGHRGCPRYSIFTIEQGGNLLFLKTWMLEQKTNPFGIVVTYSRIPLYRKLLHRDIGYNALRAWTPFF